MHGHGHDTATSHAAPSLSLPGHREQAKSAGEVTGHSGRQPERGSSSHAPTSRPPRRVAVTCTARSRALRHPVNRRRQRSRSSPQVTQPASPQPARDLRRTSAHSSSVGGRCANGPRAPSSTRPGQASRSGHSEHQQSAPTRDPPVKVGTDRCRVTITRAARLRALPYPGDGGRCLTQVAAAVVTRNDPAAGVTHHHMQGRPASDPHRSWLPGRTSGQQTRTLNGHLHREVSRNHQAIPTGHAGAGCTEAASPMARR